MVASKPSFADYAEAFSWLACLSIVFNYYNAVGEFARMRGGDYTEYIATRYDAMVPCYPLLIIPYILVYFIPFVFFFDQLFVTGLDLGKIRRAWGVQLLVIIAGTQWHLGLNCTSINRLSPS